MCCLYKVIVYTSIPKLGHLCFEGIVPIYHRKSRCIKISPHAIIAIESRHVIILCFYPLTITTTIMSHTIAKSMSDSMCTHG